MANDQPTPFSVPAACPVPFSNHSTVQMAHGGGGRMAQRLLDQLILPAFANSALGESHDGAVLDLGGQRLALTTDGHVVRPRFFPGGDIGCLAVHGTVNDLLVCGARPMALSASLILEEGFELAELQRIIESMSEAARGAGVEIVTGDTKVVEHGCGDGVFICTTGVGAVLPGVDVRPRNVEPGDVVLLSGEMGAHGVAVLAARENLGLESTIVSDTAALTDLVLPILERCGRQIHVLRDPTRGGVAATLNEIARTAGVEIALQEQTLPVSETVRGACELLGLDPLYVANEGKVVAIVHPDAAETVLSHWRAHPLGVSASQIGVVKAGQAGLVTLLSPIGGTRVVDLLSGEQLPRIC